MLEASEGEVVGGEPEDTEFQGEPGGGEDGEGFALGDGSSL